MMLKFISKVRIDFNASDPRAASCLELLSKCNARRARDSNPACQVLVNRRLDDGPPRIALTFVNGSEEEIDAAETPARSVTELIREKGRFFEAERMFRQYGSPWPVFVPGEELLEPVPDGLKTVVQKEKNDTRAFTGAELRVRLTSFNRFVDPKGDTSNMDVDATEAEAEEKSSRKKKKAHKKKKETEEEDLL